MVARMYSSHFSLYAHLHHFLQLKHEYDLVKKMRDQSGWGWDYETNTPEVSDEVWDAYIKVSLAYNVTISYLLCRNHPTQMGPKLSARKAFHYSTRSRNS